MKEDGKGLLRTHRTRSSNQPTQFPSIRIDGDQVVLRGNGNVPQQASSVLQLRSFDQLQYAQGISFFKRFDKGLILSINN